MTESAVGAADLDELDDAELIVRVRQREPEAFRVLYERHRDAVTRYARQSARNTAEAEDFVAETFVRVLQQLHDGRGPSTTFRAYAFTVVRNLAADRGRRSAREEVVAGLPEGSEQRDELAQRVERDYIRRAFKNLPSRWQRVLWLSEVEGCKPAEMAPVLGVNASAASALAYRAREGLRQAYLLVHLGPDTPDDCRRTVDRLPAYVRSALPPASAERVDDHLEECTSCRARHYEVAELDQNLRGLLLPLLLGGTAAAGSAAGSVAGSSGAAAGGAAALVSGQWRRLRELVSNPAVAVAVVVGLAVVGVGVLASLPGLLSSDKSTVPPAAASPPAQGSSAPAVAPAPVRTSPRAVVGGGGASSPPVEGTRPVAENRRTTERPSGRPEASSRPPRETSPPTSTPPSAEPTTPTPTPPAGDRCVELLVVKICGS